MIWVVVVNETRFKRYTRLKLFLFLVFFVMLFSLDASHGQLGNLDLNYSSKSPHIGELIAFNASPHLEKIDSIGISIQKTKDSSYIITGEKDPGDVWLIKTDSFGNKKWDRTFGGSGRDFGVSVKETEDGGYIVNAGTTSYSYSGYGVWLIKTDSDGKEEWNKTFQGLEPYGDDFMNWVLRNTVQQTQDGGYIITGYNKSLEDSSKDILLIKIDPLGREEWNRSFGGSGNEWGLAVQSTNDGGYILLGAEAKKDSLWSSDTRLVLIRTDSDGVQRWKRELHNYMFLGTSVHETQDGGFAVVGIGLGPSMPYGDGTNDSKIWLIKTDADGGIMRAKIFHRPGNWAFFAEEMRDGGNIISGINTTCSDTNCTTGSWLLRVDSKGNEMWDEAFHGVIASATETDDDGYVVVGTNSEKLNEIKDLRIMKTNSVGKEIWEKIINGSNVRYEWDFGDGAKGVGEKAMHSYSATGKYHVTLTLLRDNSKMSEIKKSILVRKPGAGPDLEVIKAEAHGAFFPWRGMMDIVRVEVNFTVKNVGNEPVTEKFYTQVLLANTSETVERTHLDPGESFSDSVVLIFGTLGYRSVILGGVIADSGNSIPELNEENNQKVVETVILH